METFKEDFEYDEVRVKEFLYLIYNLVFKIIADPSVYESG